MIFVIIENLLYFINILIGILFGRWVKGLKVVEHYPSVGVVVTYYKESEDIIRSCVESLQKQTYKGKIKLYLVVDGIKETAAILQKYKDKNTIVICKEQRKGKVDSSNTGLKASNEDIIVTFDGDSVANKDSIANIVKPFIDKDVIAVSGHLIPLNTSNLISKLQYIEYCVGIQLFRSGSSPLNTVNIISGAFGAYRREVLLAIGGWESCAAEDFDLTLKLKTTYPNKKFKHASDAFIYTDVPMDCKTFIKQRIRWDGDAIFIIDKYISKLLKMNFLTMIYFILHNIYLGLVNPILIFTYFIFTLISYGYYEMFILFLTVYFIYTALTLFMYITYYMFFGKNDLKYIPYILIFAIFKMFSTLITNTAFLFELFANNNKDSAMLAKPIKKN